MRLLSTALLVVSTREKRPTCPAAQVKLHEMRHVRSASIGIVRARVPAGPWNRIVLLAATAGDGPPTLVVAEI